MGANYGGDGPRKQFFNIIDGLIIRSVKKEEAVNQMTGQVHAGYRSRTKKTGDIAYEREVPFGITGKIDRIELTQHPQFGSQLEVHIKDSNPDEPVAVLQFTAAGANKSFSDYAKSLIEQLPFIDFSEELRINSFKFSPQDSEKTYYGLSVFVTPQGAASPVSIKSLHKDEIAAARQAMPEVPKSPDPTNPQKKLHDWTAYSMKVYDNLQAGIKRLVEFKAQPAAAGATGGAVAVRFPTPQQQSVGQAADITDDLPF